MLPDGRVDFVGRRDSQVKVRGFRIELPEIEAVIREYPGISDATVQAFADERAGLKFDGESMSVFFRDVEKAYAGEELEKEDFTGSVGMFVHTLPAVCDLIEEEDGRDLIARMGKQLTESMSNDIYSFSEISRELEVSPDVMFVYQADLGEVKTIGGLPALARPSTSTTPSLHSTLT